MFMRSRILSPLFRAPVGVLRPLSRNALMMTRFQSTLKTTKKDIKDEESSIEEETGPKPMTVDRELPDPFKDRTKNRLQFVAFVALMFVSSALMFNYEKTSSPVVTTTLHFLRRSTLIREVLGDEIDFASLYPWVSGELNQVKGAVDIEFSVKGSKKAGLIRLVADRKSRNDDFLIHEWSLEVDGKKYDLLADKSVDFSV